MRTAGELVTDDPWAFAFRVLEPAPDSPRQLLVLLHGVDGDELQLADLGAGVADDTQVVLPRGPRTIAGERCGWFREGHGDEDGPQVVLEEARESLGKLATFLGQWQQRLDLSPAQTVLAGFSQGGMLCAAAALAAPSPVSGFAMLGGRLLAEFTPVAGALTEVSTGERSPPEGRTGPSRLRALVAHGRGDETVPVAHAHDAAATLRAMGVDTRLCLHAGDHALSPAMTRDFLVWFGRP